MRSRRPALSSAEIAQRSHAVFDVPRRTRLLLTVAGLVGVGLIAMESLVGNQQQTIEADKFIHFAGYGLLALMFVLALRPALYIPVLLLLFSLGMAIEALQVLNERSFELADQYANTLGLVLGALAGLVIRKLYAFIRADLAAAEVRRRLVRYRAGELVSEQGELLRRFAIIKAGQVRLTRIVDGKETELGILGPGEAVGAVGVIQGRPQYARAVAVVPTTLYHMDLEQLLQSTGGREQPAALLLDALARYVRRLGDRLVEAESEIEVAPSRRKSARRSPG